MTGYITGQRLDIRTEHIYVQTTLVAQKNRKKSTINKNIRKFYSYTKFDIQPRTNGNNVKVHLKMTIGLNYDGFKLLDGDGNESGDSW